MTIRTRDGRTFSNTVYAPKGAGVHGINWADVDAKYRTLVPRAQVSDRQVEASLQVIHDFHQVRHVTALTDLLQAHTHALTAYRDMRILLFGGMGMPHTPRLTGILTGRPPHFPATSRIWEQ